MPAIIERDLTPAARDAYQELARQRAYGQTPERMREYVQGLDGALTPTEHERLEAWVQAEACEPVRRRWKIHVSPAA